MATISLGAQRTTDLWTSTLVVARRAVLRFLRTPQLIVLGTIQGAMFLLMFRYVFGGAIGAGELRYVDFLVPRFVTTGCCSRVWERRPRSRRTSSRDSSTGSDRSPSRGAPY